eukprot:CAMPEP_0119128866 /NCGR_PEP_ID=MMETSP1310-20130426/6845_1 /TAXON_ID=464262 /ORGANISM="Genus nov. species nov., Strain RCC2339" /LENGTH=163 /DNA_ID=CAMNT_0007119239 /DNA_START=102 /DNA_END=593 /DNA_ORIENTATION=+
MKVIALVIVLVAVVAAKEWDIPYCANLQQCEDYLVQCAGEFETIVSGETAAIPTNCQLFRPCPPGYLYTTDAFLNGGEPFCALGGAQNIVGQATSGYVELRDHHEVFGDCFDFTSTPYAISSAYTLEINDAGDSLGRHQLTPDSCFTAYDDVFRAIAGKRGFI